MGLIIKIHDKKFKKDYYLEWSTICDAPLTYGCDLREFKKYYKHKYGTHGMKDLQERLGRVEETGCSSLDSTELKSILSNNRAGKNEKKLSLEDILENFCRNRVEEK